jgi:long-chain acyl-CoA synthetase
MGLYDFTLYDVIARNSRLYANRPAWLEIDDQRALTFAALKTKVDRLADGLRQSGLRHGNRIGVLGKNSLEYFLLYGAAAALGAIVLPINWRLSEQEVLHNLQDCEPAALFADLEYQGLVESLKKKLPSVQRYYNLKSNQGAFLDLEAVMQTGAELTPPQVSSDDGFVIIHTAAVAGKPRGALLSHANLICANMQMIHSMRLTDQDAHLSLLPLFHVGGLFTATAAFHAGALNINMSKFDADKAVQLIEEKKISLLFDFPPILASILEKAQADGKNIGSLRAVIGLGTEKDITRYQQVTGGNYYNLYGQTETSCIASIGKYNDCPGSAGRMILLGDVRVVDDHDRPVAANQEGEIVVKGPMVFKGYWNLEEDNRYTFRNGWHHTGDLGRFDENGFLWYAGRKPEKELIKPGGENVYPAEVETAILQHADVKEVVVFGVPDPKWKEGIKAVCVKAAGSDLTAQALIAFVGDRIARFKKPRYVEFVDALPTTESGSVDRKKVKSLYGGDQA